MKKRISLIIVALLTLSLLLCSCSKTSDEAQLVIDKINEIGDVEYDDEALLGECEDAYSSLTDEQKKEVSNLSTLADARETMDALLAARPIPFSEANWETTQEELEQLYGSPAEEYDNDNYGHGVVYENIEHEGYTGTAKYFFENGTLTRVFFTINEYDADAITYFQDLFRTKYGEPTYSGDDGNYRWDTQNVSAFAMGTPLFGGLVNVVYMSPDLLTEE